MARVLDPRGLRPTFWFPSAEDGPSLDGTDSHTILALDHGPRPLLTAEEEMKGQILALSVTKPQRLCRKHPNISQPEARLLGDLSKEQEGRRVGS